MKSDGKLILKASLALIFLFSTIISLLPYVGASKQNMIGYKSICSFSPISSIFTLVLAVYFALQALKYYHTYLE